MKRFLLGILAASLAGGASAQIPASAATPDAGKDKLICKRETPIGSLIATRKRCMTATQWEKLAQDHNDDARRMQMEFATRSRGN